MITWELEEFWVGSGDGTAPPTTAKQDFACGSWFMLKDHPLNGGMLVGASHQAKPDAAVSHEGGTGPQSLLRAKQTIYSRD